MVGDLQADKGKASAYGWVGKKEDMIVGPGVNREGILGTLLGVLQNVGPILLSRLLPPVKAHNASEMWFLGGWNSRGRDSQNWTPPCTYFSTGTDIYNIAVDQLRMDSFCARSHS